MLVASLPAPAEPGALFSGTSLAPWAHLLGIGCYLFWRLCLLFVSGLRELIFFGDINETWKSISEWPCGGALLGGMGTVWSGGQVEPGLPQAEVAVGARLRPQIPCPFSSLETLDMGELSCLDDFFWR